MSKVVTNCIKSFKKTNIYKFIVLYLILGALIFTINRSEYSYLELVIHAFGHPFVMSIFLIPSISFTVYYVYDKYLFNYNYFLRLLSRKNITKNNLIMLFFIIIDYLITFLIIIFLFANIFANRNEFIGMDDYYRISNVIMLIYYFVKNFIFLYIIGMLSLLFKKKYHIIFIASLILICSSFLGYIPNRIIRFFPSYYVTSYHLFYKFYLDILYSSLYLLINYLLTTVLFFKRWSSDLE